MQARASTCVTVTTGGRAALQFQLEKHFVVPVTRCCKVGPMLSLPYARSGGRTSPMTQTLHSPSWSEPDQPSAATSPFTRFAAMPAAAGLYNPENEKDACGLAI